MRAMEIIINYGLFTVRAQDSLDGDNIECSLYLMHPDKFNVIPISLATFNIAATERDNIIEYIENNMTIYTERGYTGEVVKRNVYVNDICITSIETIPDGRTIIHKGLEIIFIEPNEDYSAASITRGNGISYTIEGIKMVYAHYANIYRR